MTQKSTQLVLGILAIIFLVVATLFTLLLNKGTFPTNHVAFDLNDKSISYPYLPSTINGYVNVAVNTIISLGVGITWIFYHKSQIRVHTNFTILASLLIYNITMGGMLVNLFTNVFKHMIGGLRPHFLEKCMVNGTLRDEIVAKTGATWVDIDFSEIICTNTHKPEYRWSHPSGHASTVRHIRTLYQEISKPR